MMSDMPNVNPVFLLDQLKQVGREFRTKCKSGDLPRIEDCLRRVPEGGRENLFQNLLQHELLFRSGRGETPCSASYIKRFPQYQKLIRQAFFESTQLSREVGNYKVLDNSITMEFHEPTQLGDYLLIRRLGQGGYGVVYEARHLATQNTVALKTLSSDMDGHEIKPERLHRFRKEFRAISQYNHPNLVGMLTLEVDQGKWFFTMDMIDGVDFLSYVRPHNILIENRLRKAAAQLAQGIIALHEHGIIHRDLKPSNVMVEVDTTVKILDFGMVTELKAQGKNLPTDMMPHFSGTPKYAAPEQMFGDRSETADWYAFGVMLYEALTGKSPFRGVQMEILKRKQVEEAPQLAGKTALPQDLALLVDALLAKDPADRPSREEISELLDLDFGTHSSSFSRTSHDSGVWLGDFDEDDSFSDAGVHEEFDLIGRDEQLELLHETQAEFQTGSEPHVVFVKGLSGEGKSSLIEKFLAPFRQNQEMLILSGKCYDRESVPFKAIDSVIDPLVRFLATRPSEELAHLIPDDIQYLAFIFPLLRKLSPIAELPNDDVTGADTLKLEHRGFSSFQNLLTNLSDDYRVMFVIDDLQWGDPDSADVVSSMLNSEDAPPILFLGSYRSDEEQNSPFLHRWRPNSQNSQLKTQLVEVGSFTYGQCLELLINWTGMDESRIRPHADKIYKQSGGNPYFVEQLAEGFDRDTGQFSQVPLSELVAGRLRNLPTLATKLLQLVAAYGQPIQAAELSRAAGCNKPELGILTHMRSERLVRLTGYGDQTWVDTYHERIRRLVLSGMPTSKIVQMRRVLGATIAKHNSEELCPSN